MYELETVAENYAGVFDTRLGFGERPALLNVDFIGGYVIEDSPFFAPPSYRRFTTACLSSTRLGCAVFPLSIPELSSIQPVRMEAYF